MYSHYNTISKYHCKHYTNISIHVQNQGLQSHNDLTPVKMLG